MKGFPWMSVIGTNLLIGIFVHFNTKSFIEGLGWFIFMWVFIVSTWAIKDWMENGK